MQIVDRKEQVLRSKVIPLVLFLEFFETPRNWYPRVVLAMGSNFTSCLVEARRSDRREF